MDLPADERLLREQIERLQAEKAKLGEAIRNVQKAAVHGMYGESPETSMFDDALHELYALAPQEDK